MSSLLCQEVRLSDRCRAERLAPQFSTASVREKVIRTMFLGFCSGPELTIEDDGVSLDNIAERLSDRTAGESPALVTSLIAPVGSNMR